MSSLRVSEITGETVVTEKPTQILVESTQIQEFAPENVEEAALLRRLEKKL